MSELEFFLKKPFWYKWRKKGFNVQFYLTLSSTYFRTLDIKTIIDIGANTGQSTITFRKAFPNAVIHAFEPLPDCFQELTDNLAKFDNVILYNVAIGDQNGSVVFEQNDYSASSSVLPMSNEHIVNFPYTKNRKVTSVKIETLDSIMRKDELDNNILIKIDVQGYEKNVILGAQDIISKAKIIIVETSFEKLYDGQPLFNDIYNLLNDIGFCYAGAFDQLLSPVSQKILQQDAIFIKS